MIAAEHGLCRPLRASDRDAFAAEGVSPAALTWTAWGALSIVAIDRVRFDVGARFEFARHLPETAAGLQNAYVVPLHDGLGQTADLMAFRDDGHVGLWLGRITVAGEEQVNGPRIGEPLRVHETVLAWLKAGRTGIVIINQERAVGLLDRIELAVTSADHLHRLERLLTRRPRIVLADDGRRNDNAAQAPDLSRGAA